MTDHGWIDEIDWMPDGPPWLAMGLARVATSAWLLPDDHRAEELAERRGLVAERRDDVFAAVPGTEDAAAELLGLVVDWERHHRPDLAAVPVVEGEHPLVAAGLRTQEDLVLMVPHGRTHHLGAALLCFPSHWRLRDKVGGSALAIHGPVPGYEAELGAKVDRFLDRLRPGVVVARRNWTVHDADDRFAPDPPDHPVPVPPEAVADQLWLRSERQTLRRLPRTGAIAFTIRVQQAPFGALAHHPAAAVGLAARLRAQPDELTAMNGLLPHRAGVLAWLGEVAGDRASR